MVMFQNESLTETLTIEDGLLYEVNAQLCSITCANVYIFL